MARIALNGLGRIGKLLLRDLAANGPLADVVLLNDARGEASLHAHLLEFDTVHGRWETPVGHDGAGLVIDGRTVALHHERTLEALPLEEHGIDLVIDCSGAFRTSEAFRPCFDAGVARVLVSAPVKSAGALNIVYGVNHGRYDPARHRLVTAASCTTNCLAPVVKVLHEGIGIRHGSITTLHDVTNTQTLVDRPASDLRRARSALNSLIPTTTGSATAIAAIFPELEGRLNGHAVRVPLLNASLTDCVFEMRRTSDVDEINGLLESASRGELDGILGFESRPLVSADYVNDPRSGVVDGPSTMVVGGTQAKLYVWYDNEWGYACRLGDIARLMTGTA